MAVTNFTPLLGLALPTTGDLSGTWGTTVNTAITDLLDDAVAGTVTLSADADVTLTTTNGADNQARNAVILWTASNGATTRNITAPAQSKAYIVINAGTGSVVIRGAGPTTGVTLVTGEKALCAWNGSDFVKVSTSVADGVTSVAATVPSIFSVTGSPITSSGTLAMTYSGTALPVANGGTALTAGTSGGVLAYTATGTLASSGALTQYGVVLGGGAGAVPTSTAVGTAAQVLTSNGPGVAPTFQTPAASGASKGQAIAFSIIFGL